MFRPSPSAFVPFTLACTLLGCGGPQAADPGADPDPTALGGKADGAGNATFDFEDLADGTRLTNQYGTRGVLFSGAYVSASAPTHSGTRVLFAGNPGGEFHPPPMGIDFSSAKSRVSLFARAQYPGGTTRTTLRAFDAAGAVLATDGPKALTNTALVSFQVSTTSARIRRVELFNDDTSFEIIDDLVVVGQPPPPPPTGTPVVTITEPTAGSTVAVRDQMARGTVTGNGLRPPGKLLHEIRRPPGSLVPPFSTPLALAGTGTSLTFQQALQLGIGPQTITVSAENTAARTGTRSIEVTYFPTALKARIDQEAATLGAFSFGSQVSGCTYAVYERGAVALVGRTTRTIRGAILDKWRGLKDLNGYPKLGCPMEDERAVAGDAARAQLFSGGRIYATASGAFQVPRIFADAIDARGGERASGIPVADPTQSIGVYETWLFQRFRAPGLTRPTGTLEIRGTPARLYLERVAGDRTAADITDEAPTIVEHYACASSQGPCPITAPSDAPLPNPGTYCNNEKYDWEGVEGAWSDITGLDTSPNPAEWAAIVGQHTLTPVWGVVATAKRSHIDNPYTHDNRYGPCVKGVSSAFDALSVGADYLLDDRTEFCSSDMHVKLVPLPGYKSLIAAGQSNPDVFTIEFEEYYGRPYLYGNFREPFRNDLVFAAGRWIIDCGHTPYHSEIHPPQVMAHMRTQTRNGRPETAARIWVNGYFTGDPIDLELHAPPRPSPTANLVLVRPRGDELDVTLADSMPSLQYVRVRISSPTRRLNAVDGQGKVSWQTGRGTQGTWTVGWDQ